MANHQDSVNRILEGHVSLEFLQRILAAGSRTTNLELAGTILESILENHEVLSVVAQRSYAHGLLFDKFVLSPPREDGYVLRLHAWWPSTPRPSDDIDIHNHARDFTTRLLHGSYRQQIWLPEAGGTPYYGYHCATNHDRMQGRLDYVGMETLALKEERWVRAGEWYQMNTSPLHRLIPDWSTLTLSLVVQGANRATTSTVLSGRLKDVGDCGCDFQVMETNMLRTKLVTIIEVIAGERIRTDNDVQKSP